MGLIAAQLVRLSLFSALRTPSVATTRNATLGSVLPGKIKEIFGANSTKTALTIRFAQTQSVSLAVMLLGCLPTKTSVGAACAVHALPACGCSHNI